MTTEPLKLPWDPDAEQAVLGGALIGADDLADVAGWLAPADFHAAEHAAIWRAICGLVERRAPCDRTTVAGALRDAAALDAGGITLSVLNHLAGAVPETPGIAGQAEVVRDLARRRAVLAFGRAAMRAALEGIGPAGEIIDRVQQEALALAGPQAGGPAPLSDALPGIWTRLAAQHEAGANAPTGAIPTGLCDLDEFLDGGLRGGELVLLGGRPSMGKTALAVRFLRGALAGGGSALFFSQEQPRDQIALRAWSVESNVPLRLLRRPGLMGPADWEQIAPGADRMSRGWPARLWLDDTPGRSPGDVAQTARRLKARVPNLVLVVVDYLQLMRLGSGRSENREREVSAGSYALKTLARELNVPLLVLSQLNRSLEQRSDKRPRLSDLRDSGSLEQDADVVLFVYRDEVYNPGIAATAGTAEVQIAKQRNGPLGMAKLLFRGAFTDFESLADPDRLPPEPEQRPAAPIVRRDPQRDWMADRD